MKKCVGSTWVGKLSAVGKGFETYALVGAVEVGARGDRRPWRRVSEDYPNPIRPRDRKRDDRGEKQDERSGFHQLSQE